MNRRQKSLFMNFIVMVIITGAFAFLMINLRSVLNRSEAMRAMEELGKAALQYRTRTGALPSEVYLRNMIKQIEGSVRLGHVRYRAMWIETGASPDTILAYASNPAQSLFVPKGYVVLRLGGSVEYMRKNDFEELLAKQQTEAEVKLLIDPKLKE
ncbi:MAG: hypothetical protein ABIG61_11030 [Planctomycetota bacterium]